MSDFGFCREEEGPHPPEGLGEEGRGELAPQECHLCGGRQDRPYGQSRQGNQFSLSWDEHVKGLAVE